MIKEKRAPHAATVVQTKVAQPHPATMQRKETPLGMTKVPPHPATVQRKEAPPGMPKAQPHAATVHQAMAKGVDSTTVIQNSRRGGKKKKKSSSKGEGSNERSYSGTLESGYIDFSVGGRDYHINFKLADYEDGHTIYHVTDKSGNKKIHYFFYIDYDGIQPCRPPDEFSAAGTSKMFNALKTDAQSFVEEILRNEKLL